MARFARAFRPAAMGVCALAMPAAVWAATSNSRYAAMAPNADVEVLANTAPKGALDPNEFRGFKLLAVKQLTHDTAQYTFELPHENDELGLSVASCLVIKGEADGKAVVRPYTPTSPVHQRGTFDLIIKTYPNGKVSQWIAGQKPGASVEMKGPFVKFSYAPNQWEAVGMIAGGSGITPMYQLITEILANPRDRTEVRLVYASRSPADIILKTQLDALQVQYPNFKVLYTVDAGAGATNWSGATGHISKDMLTSFLPPPQPGAAAPKYKVLVCGPPGMMQATCGEKKSPTDQGELSGLLKDLHYSPEQVFKY